MSKKPYKLCVLKSILFPVEHKKHKNTKNSPSNRSDKRGVNIIKIYAYFFVSRLEKA